MSPLDLSSPTLLGVSLTHLGMAFLIILSGMGLSKLSTYLFGKLCKRVEDQKGVRATLFRAAEKPSGWLFIVLSIYFSLAIFPLPSSPVDLPHLVQVSFLAGSIVLAIWFGTNLIDGFSDLWAEKASKTSSAFDDQLVPIVRKSAKVFLVIAGGVMIVQNLGYSVSSLLAGLGIGGAALALASKDTVANIFGSIVIFLDQPFYVGDWIEIGDKEGTVEEVGLRVTRIRTFANSVITIPNSQLTTMAINNWSRMRKRRITFTARLPYGTRPDQMVAAVEAIRKVIRNDPRLCQDFSLVNFTELGPHSLDILVYCFTTTTNWAEHLQIRQEFLLEIMGEIDALGLDFALPTQTVNMAGTEMWVPAQAPAAMDRQFPH